MSAKIGGAIAAIVVLGALIGSATDFQFWLGSGVRGHAEQVIASAMRDPDSAQFRNVIVTDAVAGETVCGEVNGKNLLGAYVGYRRFIVSPIRVMLEENENADAFAVQWEINCR